jgi:hypothetical protein
LNYGPVYDPERQAAREMLQYFIKVSRSARKPLAISVCASLEEEDYIRDDLGVPVFHFPGDAVRALAYSRDFALRPSPDDPKLERPDLPEKSCRHSGGRRRFQAFWPCRKPWRC